MDYSSHESSFSFDIKPVEWEKLVEQQGEENSLDIGDTWRSLRAKIQNCKEDNNKLIDAQERIARA